MKRLRGTASSWESWICSRFLLPGSRVGPRRVPSRGRWQVGSSGGSSASICFKGGALTSAWIRRPLPPPRTSAPRAGASPRAASLPALSRRLQGGPPSAAGTRRATAWRGSYARR